jgi:3-dehydroquinate synthase
VRSLKVPLGGRTYLIGIGPGLLGRLGLECKRLGLGSQCAILTDRKVAHLYAEQARASLKSVGIRSFCVTFPAGERSKSMAGVEACCDAIAAQKLERGGFVVALGGGVVGDLAGFVAATYLRGLPFVQVPTTLLAQVDSSVGGKVGVNLKSGKNLVGAFYQPRLVLCDLNTLATLPEREYRSGLAEVIKYGVIFDDRLFQRLEDGMEKLTRRNPALLESVVERCCAIKAKVVGRDERDHGLRAILNFGHTVGHALEAVSGYGKYLHGEAIALGQVAAARLSHWKLDLPEQDVERIRCLFDRAGLPTRLKLRTSQRRKLISAMALDKKVAGGRIRFVLARRIGRSEFGHEVSAPAIDRALRSLAASPATRLTTVNRSTRKSVSPKPNA